MFNKNSKPIKKEGKDWRTQPPTTRDKLKMNYALASYLIETKQTRTLPAPTVTTVREMLPFLAEEDIRWVGIHAHRFMSTGYPIYKSLCDLVKNTLSSKYELEKHIKAVKERINQDAQEADDAEEELANGHQSEEDEGNEDAS